MKRLFEKAFTPPFKTVKYGSWIEDSKGEMCMQFRISDPKDRQELLIAINTSYVQTKFSDISYELGFIRHSNTQLIEIRGWGYLTGSGGLKISDTEAADIQDDLGNYIVEQLTKK